MAVSCYFCLISNQGLLYHNECQPHIEQPVWLHRAQELKEETVVTTATSFQPLHSMQTLSQALHAG